MRVHTAAVPACQQVLDILTMLHADPEARQALPTFVNDLEGDDSSSADSGSSSEGAEAEGVGQGEVPEKDHGEGMAADRSGGRGWDGKAAGVRGGVGCGGDTQAQGRNMAVLLDEEGEVVEGGGGGHGGSGGGKGVGAGANYAGKMEDEMEGLDSWEEAATLHPCPGEGAGMLTQAPDLCTLYYSVCVCAPIRARGLSLKHAHACACACLQDVCCVCPHALKHASSYLALLIVCWSALLEWFAGVVCCCGVHP